MSEETTTASEAEISITYNGAAVESGTMDARDLSLGILVDCNT